MKSDEILEIIVKPNLKREFNKYVEKEGYEIFEEIREKDECQTTPTWLSCVKMSIFSQKSVII